MYVMLDTAYGNNFRNSPSETKKLKKFLQKKYPQIFDTFDVNTVYGVNNFGEQNGAVVIDTDINGLYKLSEICNCPVILTNENLTYLIPYGVMLYDGYIE